MTDITATEPLRLAWGYRAHGLPADTRAAFGARLIVRQTGSADLLHDRQDLTGRTSEDRHEFIDLLNAGLLRHLLGMIEVMLSEYVLRTDRGEPFVLWQDAETGVTAVVDTQGSYGYAYLTVFVQ